MARASLDVFEVLDAGVQTTIQDIGRRGYEAEGVPRAGAADAIGLAVANALLGNPAHAAALECTLLGLRLQALVDLDVAIGGGDLGAVVEAAVVEAAVVEPRPSGPRTVAPGTSHRMAKGQVLAFTGRSDDPPVACRAYVAVPGGIDVPVVLGSRSTCLPAGFGGLDGRPLRPGDRLRAADGPVAAHVTPARLGARAAAELPSPAQRLRILPGPASAEGDVAFDGLTARSWLVDPASDRRGLRLDPADAAADVAGLAPLGAGELPSLGVLPGAIQVTPSGRPVILMADSGTTGGYPVVAIVIQADLPLLGQLAPGAEVRFRPVSAEDARTAAADRRRMLAELAGVAIASYD